MHPFSVGSWVRVLPRALNPHLEAEAPEQAALMRWQMGRVFRVIEVSPAGHVGIDRRDVDGNEQPSPLHPGFLHASLVVSAVGAPGPMDEADLSAALARADRLLAERRVTEALRVTATNVQAAQALGIPRLVFEAWRQHGWAEEFAFQLEPAARAFEAALAEEPRLPRDAHHDRLAFDTRVQYLSVLRRLPGVDAARLLGAIRAALTRTLTALQRSRVLVVLSLYLDESGDTVGAVAAARDIVSLLPDIKPEQRSWPGSVAARALRRGGQADESLRLLDTLESVQSEARDRLRLLHERGHALLAAGRPAEAAAIAARVLHLADVCGTDARIAAMGLAVETALATGDGEGACALAAAELDLVRTERADTLTLFRALLDMADAWLARGETNLATPVLDEAMALAAGLDQTTGGTGRAREVQRRRDAQLLLGC